jgi:ferrochelatase
MARDLPSGKRVAVVLFNLGGPDKLSSVRPFLFNLFVDPAIIGLPAIVRYPLAAVIATGRARSSRVSYARMGGASPLLPESTKQADALQSALSGKLPGATVRCFIAMRYWLPLTKQTARDVAEFEPDEIILLPLYPQFSTTTTESSVKAWKKAYRGPGRVREVCCYPRLDGFIKAHAAGIRRLLDATEEPVRVLFSAHGLPEKTIASGDPYARQVEATAAAVAAELNKGRAEPIDWQVCYQSRVGPLPWIGPFTIDAIEQAGCDGLGVVICPIAFVSEHVETLIELDHDYAKLAETVNCRPYLRVPALGADKAFVGGLADAVMAALAKDTVVAPAQGWACDNCGPICPAQQAQAAKERA